MLDLVFRLTPLRDGKWGGVCINGVGFHRRLWLSQAVGQVFTWSQSLVCAQVLRNLKPGESYTCFENPEEQGLTLHAMAFYGHMWPL